MLELHRIRIRFPNLPSSYRLAPPPLRSGFRCRARHLPRGRLAGMAVLTSSAASPISFTELRDESDFESVLSPEGYISVCGFGSLLSERSARSTFPDLKNFRVAFLRRFRRVFAHVAPIFYERGVAKDETKVTIHSTCKDCIASMLSNLMDGIGSFQEVSSLSVEPCEEESLIITVFDITKSEISSFIERENEFRFLAVVPEGLDGAPFTNSAVICARYSDDEFFQIRCKGNEEIYFKNYGRYNIHRIWRDDILPCRVYLRHCVLAAKNLGETTYDNFLDHTFLGDRKTTIREYLSSAGSGVMEEEPPESLRSRYGG